MLGEGLERPAEVTSFALLHVCLYKESTRNCDAINILQDTEIEDIPHELFAEHLLFEKMIEYLLSYCPLV